MFSTVDYYPCIYCRDHILSFDTAFKKWRFKDAPERAEMMVRVSILLHILETTNRWGANGSIWCGIIQLQSALVALVKR